MSEAAGRRAIDQIHTPDQDLRVLSRPSGMTVSTRALTNARRRVAPPTATPADSIAAPGCRPSGPLLVVADLRRGETYADLACGFAIGTDPDRRLDHIACEIAAYHVKPVEVGLYDGAEGPRSSSVSGCGLSYSMYHSRPGNIFISVGDGAGTAGMI